MLDEYEYIEDLQDEGSEEAGDMGGSITLAHGKFDEISINEYDIESLTRWPEIRSAGEDYIPKYINKTDEETILINVEQKTIRNSKFPNLVIRVEKAAYPDTPNYQYIITITDLETKASARSLIYEMDGILRELINSGSIELTSRYNQKHLMSTVKRAISFAKSDIGSKYTTNSHYIVGWKSINDNKVYFGNAATYLNPANKDEGNESTHVDESKFSNNDLIRMSRDGTFEGWLNELGLRWQRPIPAIVIISAFAGILREMYEALQYDTQILISLAGPSSIGKTTLIKGAHTVFTSNTEYLDYAATLNSITKRISMRSPIVASIDDILQMSDLKTRKPENLNEVIFRLAAGTDKERQGKYGVLQKADSFCSSIIITTVEPLLPLTQEDVGQYSRLIEFELSSNDIFSSQTESILADKGLQANHGWAAEAFVKALLDNESMFDSHEEFENELVRRYNSIFSEIVDKSVDDEFELLISGGHIENDETSNETDDNSKSINHIKVPRMAKRPALILLTTQLLNEYFPVSFDYDEIRDTLIENANKAAEIRSRFATLADSKTVINSDSNSISSKASKAFIQLYNYFQINNSKFKKGKYTSTGEIDNYLGYYEEDNMGTITLIIPEEGKYRRLLYIINGIEPDAIFELESSGQSESVPYDYKIDDVLDFWKNKDILDMKSGAGYVRKRTIVQGEGKQHRAYSIKLDHKIIKRITDKGDSNVTDSNNQTESKAEAD